MLFTVDETKCTGCRRCVDECPARIIVIEDNSPVPVPTEDAEERCINCGHCVAICPEEAFLLGTMPLEQCPAVDYSLFPQPAHLEHFFKARRSIRSFRDEQVDRGDLKKTIEIARFAPTGSNSQQVKWKVVYEREDVLKIAGMAVDFFRSEIAADPDAENAGRFQRILKIWDSGFDYICRGAPHLILTYAPDSKGPVDCTIALTYLELAAFSFGLGPCWGGYVMAAGRSNWPKMREFLGLPDGHTVFGAMMIGYPDYRYQRIPIRKEAEISWIT